MVTQSIIFPKLSKKSLFPKAFLRIIISNFSTGLEINPQVPTISINNKMQTIP